MDYKLPIIVRKGLNVIILLLAAVVCVMLVRQSNLVSWDFRNNLWAPSYLLVHGQSPYLISEVAPDGNAVWFPMIIGILFPIGWIELEQASMLWLITNVGAMIAILVMTYSTERSSLVHFFLGALTFLLYPRTIAHLQLGQFTIVAALLFLVSANLVAQGKLALASFLIVIAVSKPQLGILALPGMLITVRQSRPNRHWRYVFYLAMSGVLLLMPLFWGDWMWVDGFVEALRKNATWLQPTFFRLLPQMWGVWGVFAWAVTFLIIFIINMRLWQIHAPNDAIYWSLALTPLIAPYTWSWDFILGLPLFVRTIFQVKHKASLVFLLAGYMTSWILMFNIIVKTEGSDHRFWWASWGMVFLVLAAQLIDKRWSIINSIVVTNDKEGKGKYLWN